MRITFPRHGVRSWCEEKRGFMEERVWLVPKCSRGSAVSRFKAGSCPIGALRCPPRTPQGGRRLCCTGSLRLPACLGCGPGVDSISQAAPGLDHYAPAPIRGRALQPEPIVSRSRDGSELCCPGSRSAEPPAPRRLPAGPHTLQPREPRDGPGSRHAVVSPPCTRAE